MEGLLDFHFQPLALLPVIANAHSRADAADRTFSEGWASAGALHFIIALSHLQPETYITPRATEKQTRAVF